jgi:hypothetical protein
MNHDGNQFNEGVKPDLHDVDRAQQELKITGQEANDLKGLPWDDRSRNWMNQKAFIKDVHKNAGLDTSGKDW